MGAALAALDEFTFAAADQDSLSPFRYCEEVGGAPEVSSPLPAVAQLGWTVRPSCSWIAIMPVCVEVLGGMGRSWLRPFGLGGRRSDLHVLLSFERQSVA